MFQLKKIIAFVILLLTASMVQASEPSIIPKPDRMTLRQGVYIMASGTKIVQDDSEDTILSRFLNDFLTEFYGFGLQKEMSSADAIQGISFIYDASFEDEAYTLDIVPEKITVKGSQSGLFYGLQSLLQLMAPQETDDVSIPCLEIKDRPKFAYRGAMLDVGRYFYSVAEVKRFLDLMAYYKLNTFHWHLTENDGWRMEMDKYPLLTEIGAWRMGTHTTPAPREKLPSTYDKLPHGGFYTKRQIRDIIAYASKRNITIIPEIDVPGHSRAALEAYSHLSCHPDKNAGVLCLGKESTYAFVKDVLDETIALFPSEIIHIGGDEANKDAWKKCPHCQKLMRDKGLKDEDALQSYFIRQMVAYIESKGRKMIGWDEIMEGGDLTPNSMVMSWRGEEGGIKAAQMQRQVVMSPADFVYFDYFQGPKEFEPVCFAKSLPLETVYRYDPLTNISPEYQKFILGVQANIWTQCIHGQDKLDYMAYPRMLALAEVGWSRAEKDYAEFYHRMGNNLIWLTKMGVNYRVPEPLGLYDVETDENNVTVSLKPPIEGAKMYYSIDGEENLLQKGMLYDSPIRIDLSAADSVMLKCVVRTPQGMLSGIRVATYKKKTDMKSNVLSTK